MALGCWAQGLADTLLVRWRLAGASACSACAPGTYANQTGEEKKGHTKPYKEGGRGRSIEQKSERVAVGEKESESKNETQTVTRRRQRL